MRILLPLWLTVLVLIGLLVVAGAPGCVASTISPAAIAHNSKGVKELEASRLDDAEARFRLALELSPRFAEAHANLGVLIARRGDAAAGLEELDRAVELDPDLAVAHVGRGAVLASLGTIDGAIDAYEDALAIQPELVEARRNLAQLLVATDRVREARAHALRLAQLEPSRAESVALVVYCDVLLGRPEAALVRIDEADAVPRPAPALELVRGLALAAKGDSAAALVVFEALTTDPVHGEAARARRVALLADLGRLDEARRGLAAMRRLGDASGLVADLEARLP